MTEKSKRKYRGKSSVRRNSIAVMVLIALFAVICAMTAFADDGVFIFREDTIPEKYNSGYLSLTKGISDYSSSIKNGETYEYGGLTYYILEDSEEYTVTYTNGWRQYETASSESLNSVSSTYYDVKITYSISYEGGAACEDGYFAAIALTKRTDGDKNYYGDVLVRSGGDTSKYVKVTMTIQVLDDNGDPMDYTGIIAWDIGRNSSDGTSDDHYLYSDGGSKREGYWVYSGSPITIDSSTGTRVHSDYGTFGLTDDEAAYNSVVMIPVDADADDGAVVRLWTVSSDGGCSMCYSATPERTARNYVITEGQSGTVPSGAGTDLVTAGVLEGTYYTLLDDDTVYDYFDEVTGYTLNFWYTDEDCTEEVGFTTEELNDGTDGDNLIWYGYYDPYDYTITYHSNNGSDTTMTQSAVYDVSAALKSSGFTKTGYVLSGWNTKADGSGTSYDLGESVTNLKDSGSTIYDGYTTNLYAEWTAITYTVSYNSNGGEGTMSSSSMTYDTASALRKNTFTRTGYTFAGWSTTSDGDVEYTDGEKVKNLTSANNGVVRLYAVWTASTYTIKYDANGGSGSISSQTNISYGSYVTLSDGSALEAPSALYVLDSWNTEADGSGTAYSPGKSYMNVGNTTDGGTVTLYAQWGKRSFVSEYISSYNVWDEESGFYTVDDEWDGDPEDYNQSCTLYSISDLTDVNGDGEINAEDAFPESEGYTGYWSKLENGLWEYTFYVYNENVAYYVWEEGLTSSLAKTFTGDYTELNPTYIEDGSVVATITNSDDTSGSLSVTKEVVDEDGEDVESTKTFRIVITLTDEDGGALSGETTFGSYTFTDGVLSYNFSDGETITITNIPEGYHYEVEEILTDTLTGAYEIRYDSGQIGEIEASETAETTVLNVTGDEPSYGSLSVKKKVEDADGNTVSTDTEFTIEVTIMDENGKTLSGTQTYGGYTFTKGCCKTTIKGNQTVTFDNIPVGYRYTVTEIVNDGYTVSYSNEEGTIEEEGAVYKVVITNTQDVGALSVSKIVETSDGAETTVNDTFSVLVTLKDADGNSLSGSLSFGGFTFTDGECSLTLEDGETKTITDIPAGYQYTVEEALTDDRKQTYTASYSGTAAPGETQSITSESAGGTIISEGTSEVVITNRAGDEPDSIDLKLVKKTDGYYDTSDDAYTFIVSFSGLSESKTYYISYYESEDASDADEASSEWVSMDEAPNGSPSSFKTDSNGEAAVAVYLCSGRMAVFEQLDIGCVYQVTEPGGEYCAAYSVEDDADLDSVESAGGSAEEGAQLSTAQETADTGEEVTITFTNTIIKTVDVKLTKKSVNYDGTENTEDDAEYEILAQFSHLEAGEIYSYTDGSMTGYFKADDDGKASATVQITNGQVYTFEGLPVGAYYCFAETASVKRASYTITDENDCGLIGSESGGNDEIYKDLSTEYEIASEGELVTVTFINQTYSVPVRIAKKNTDGTLIGGAEFSLYKVNDSDGYYTSEYSDLTEYEYAEDELVEEYITTERDTSSEDYGFSDWIELTPGSYYFVETQAPDGYFVYDGIIEFEITEDDIAAGESKTVTVSDNVLLILANSGGAGVFVIVFCSISLAAAAAVFSRKRRKSYIRRSR